MRAAKKQNQGRLSLRQLLFVGAIALAGCDSKVSDSSPLPDDRSDWNLVIVLLDALPASGVGAWGYSRDVTPNLDAFAESGVRFDQAYAGASYTLASVSSMFTGLSPEAHRVVGLSSNVLAARHATLAEAFRDRGFATGGFSSNPHITEAGGFHQGFDEFRHYGRDQLDYHGISMGLEEDSLRWWNAHAEERRLLYVHVLPPHQPYDAAEPHASLFGADLTKRELGFTEYLVEADKAGTVKHGSKLAAKIRSRYDAGLHQADEFLGKYLQALKDSPGGERTVYAVLSDHGEAFAEHGRLLHGSTVYDEMTHVPLVISWPGAQPSVVEELVSTVNLAPTLCELFDLPFPRGESFLSAVWTDYESPPVLSRTVGDAPVWSLRTREWTFLKQAKQNIRLLYHRETDRGETNELLLRDQSAGGGEEPGRSQDELEGIAKELSKRMKQALVRDRGLARGVPRERNDEHRSAVEELGYGGDDEPDPVQDE